MCCCSRGSEASLHTAHFSSNNGPPTTMVVATAAQWLFLEYPVPQTESSSLRDISGSHSDSSTRWEQLVIGLSKFFQFLYRRRDFCTQRHLCNNGKGESFLFEYIRRCDLLYFPQDGEAHIKCKCKNIPLFQTGIFTKFINTILHANQLTEFI